MLKVALIGCGGMGYHHFKCWMELKDYAQVVAVADLQEEQLAKVPDDMGIRKYKDGWDLLKNENDLDLVDVVVPTYLHTQFAVAAMKKGCNVHIEKPVCLNEEEAQLLLKTQQETGAKVQIGVVCRFYAEWVWLKRAVENNTYGKVISAEFYREAPNVSWGWDNWYHDYKRSGTVALDLHIHNVDTIMWVMNGKPDSFTACVTRDEEGVIQQIFTTYQYGDVVIRAVDCWDFPPTKPFKEPYLFNFENATVSFEGNRCVTVYPNDGPKQVIDLKGGVELAVEDETNMSDMDGVYSELLYFMTTVIAENGKEIAPLGEIIESTRQAWAEVALVGGPKK